MEVDSEAKFQGVQQLLPNLLFMFVIQKLWTIEFHSGKRSIMPVIR